MRYVPLKADMTKILDIEQINALSVEAINDKIKTAFEYDEYQWQFDNKVKIGYKHRAKQMHKVLYQCPSCKTEHEMDSNFNKIWCNHCGKTYEMDVYGKLKATKGITEFSHAPDWYEWERENVRKEVVSGHYHFEDEVNVESLPNSKGYIPIGQGTLIHNLKGCHIEYDYMKKGDCIDLSTIHDTYYIYPIHKKDVVTKISLATEEIYKLEKEKFKHANKV
jgi:ribosomal protein L37AE/L43A